MKGKKWLICAAVLVLMGAMLSACGLVSEAARAVLNGETPQQGSAPEESARQEDGLIHVPYGSYKVPEGWELASEPTSEAAGKYFYVKSGVEPAGEYPTNISVEYGTNRYAVDEHEQFRTAILRQLQMQMGGDDGTLFGSGGNTENGYTLYRFGIGEDDAEVSTVQYYIVGEREFVLVHLTDFHDPAVTDADEAARAIVDSFVWGE